MIHSDSGAFDCEQVALYSGGEMKFAIALSIIVLIVAAVFGYRAYKQHQDLTETLHWMDQTYNPHDGGENFGLGHGEETHYLENRQLLTKEVTEKFRDTFAYKGDCKIVIHSETFPVGVFKSAYTNSDYTISLGDVDPGARDF